MKLHGKVNLCRQRFPLHKRVLWPARTRLTTSLRRLTGRGRGPWTGKALKTRTPKPRSGIQTAVDYRQMHRGRNCLKAGRGGVGRRLIGCRTTNNTNNNNNNSINACDSDYSLVNIGNVFKLAQFLKDSLHVVGHTHTLSNLTWFHVIPPDSQELRLHYKLDACNLFI